MADAPMRKFVLSLVSARNGSARAVVGRCGRLGRLSLTLLATALVVFLASAASAPAQPVWRLDSMANTTAAPGGTHNYLLQLNNLGDVNADGTGGDPITLTATLPSGITAQDVTLLGNHVFDPFIGAWACSGDGGGPVAGASVVTCLLPDVVGSRPAGHSAFFEDIGAASVLAIGANVDPSASGNLEASFTVSGGGAASPATTVDPTTISGNAPGYGVDAFDGQTVADAAGSAFTQAGGHPYAYSQVVDFNTGINTDAFRAYRFPSADAVASAWPIEPEKDAFVDLPPGFVGNPTIADQCTSAQLANGGSFSMPLCPPASQVGTVMVRANNLSGLGDLVFGPIPVFNMVPTPGVPASFGFNVEGSVVTLDASLRSGTDYGLSVDARNIPEALPIAGTFFNFWGVPSDPSHDTDRACPGQVAPWEGGARCSSGASPAAFLRYPTSCIPDSTGITTTIHTDSWQHPGDFKDATSVSHLPPGYPAAPGDFGPQVGTTGCDKPPFDPTLTGQPTTPPQAGQPAGFAFDLKIRQSTDPSSIGEADLKKAVVTLPEGMSVSPSSAGGLGACTTAQIGLLGTHFADPNPIHFTTVDPTCPDSSKVGTLKIDTPLLAQPLTGSIYLASPHDNPFNSLIAIYLVAKGSGVIVKLPGQVTPDPRTGQLVATFDNNPQLPFSNLHLEFKGGSRAPLAMPKQCGTYSVHADFTSWNNKEVQTDSSFDVNQNCAPVGFSPGFTAGTQNPIAGADSSFLFQLTRGDQDQDLSGLTLDMATGLTARIANAVLCPDDAANAGACSDGSKIGSVTVGAGAGTTPFYISNGSAFLTGPYKGAPFGLSIVVPAVAGPFDLGNVVVRAAVFVNRTSAQVKVVSDPFPTILQGIPLDVRDVRVISDKPHFFVNPTSCAEKHILGRVTSTQGAVAHVGSRFQVGDCGSLDFAPKLSMTVGSPHHTAAGVSTPLTATVTQPKGQANLKSVSVTLPGTLNALLPVVNRACPLADFKAGHCTSRARAGSAVATTPLLRDPLRGSVYFVKNGRPIPDLMVALRGQVAVDVDARVSIPGGKRLGTTFFSPDVPLSKFTLRLVSGGNGPLGIVTNLCTAKARAAQASVTFRGQNGKIEKLSPTLGIAGCPKAAKARRAKHH